MPTTPPFIDREYTKCFITLPLRTLWTANSILSWIPAALRVSNGQIGCTKLHLDIRDNTSPAFLCLAKQLLYALLQLADCSMLVRLYLKSVPASQDLSMGWLHCEPDELFKPSLFGPRDLINLTPGHLRWALAPAGKLLQGSLQQARLTGLLEFTFIARPIQVGMTAALMKGVALLCCLAGCESNYKTIATDPKSTGG